MPTIAAAYLLAGSLCTLGGPGILYYSWKYKPALKALFTGVGWLLLGLAVFCWSALEGWEFGLIYGITLPSLSAFTFVVLNARVNDASIDELQFISVNKPSVQTLLQFTGMTLIVLPFALATSASISYALSTLMIDSALNQLVLAICFLPVLWGLFAFWIVADTILARPVASQIALTILSLSTFIEI